MRCSLLILIGPFLILNSCIKSFSPIRYNFSSQQVEPVPIEDSSIYTMTLNYKGKLDSTMQESIGFAIHTLTKKNTESTLGNWVCDALIFFSNDSLKIQPDFAIVNYGGIRINQIDSGIIKLGQLYELMPFDNNLVMVYMDSSGISKLVSKMAYFRGWPQSASINYKLIKDSLSSFILINNSPLNSKKIYRVLMSDYIYNGGDNMDFLLKYQVDLIPVMLRDALIYSCKKLSKLHGGIQSKLDHRILKE